MRKNTDLIYVGTITRVCRLNCIIHDFDKTTRCRPPLCLILLACEINEVVPMGPNVSVAIVTLGTCRRLYESNKIYVAVIIPRVRYSIRTVVVVLLPRNLWMGIQNFLY